MGHHLGNETRGKGYQKNPHCNKSMKIETYRMQANCEFKDINHLQVTIAGSDSEKVGFSAICLGYSR